MRTPEDWQRIAAEARTRAKDRDVGALELELERDEDGARALKQMAAYWWTIADKIDCALGAEAAWPPRDPATKPKEIVYHIFTNGCDYYTPEYRLARKVFDHYRKTRPCARLFQLIFAHQDGYETKTEQCLMSYGPYPI